MNFSKASGNTNQLRRTESLKGEGKLRNASQCGIHARNEKCGDCTYVEAAELVETALRSAWKHGGRHRRRRQRQKRLLLCGQVSTRVAWPSSSDDSAVATDCSGQSRTFRRMTNTKRIENDKLARTLRLFVTESRSAEQFRKMLRRNSHVCLRLRACCVARVAKKAEETRSAQRTQRFEPSEPSLVELEPDMSNQQTRRCTIMQVGSLAFPLASEPVHKRIADANEIWLDSAQSCAIRFDFHATSLASQSH